jgi:hypothetical protein
MRLPHVAGYYYYYYTRRPLFPLNLPITTTQTCIAACSIRVGTGASVRSSNFRTANLHPAKSVRPLDPTSHYIEWDDSFQGPTTVIGCS